MITVQTTPTIAPIMAALLLLSQDPQAVVHNYKNNVCKNVHISSYVCSYIHTYLQLSTEISCKS